MWCETRPLFTTSSTFDCVKVCKPANVVISNRKWIQERKHNSTEILNQQPNQKEIGFLHSIKWIKLPYMTSHILSIKCFLRLCLPTSNKYSTERKKSHYIFVLRTLNLKDDWTVHPAVLFKLSCLHRFKTNFEISVHFRLHTHTHTRRKKIYLQSM